MFSISLIAAFTFFLLSNFTLLLLEEYSLFLLFLKLSGNLYDSLSVIPKVWFVAKQQTSLRLRVHSLLLLLLIFIVSRLSKILIVQNSIHQLIMKFSIPESCFSMSPFKLKSIFLKELYTGFIVSKDDSINTM